MKENIVRNKIKDELKLFSVLIEIQVAVVSSQSITNDVFGCGCIICCS